MIEDTRVAAAKIARGMAPVSIPVQVLDPELPFPRYAHDGDAAIDLYARKSVDITPGRRFIMPTGLAVAIPPGYVGIVCPRSGLAAREGLSVINAPGVIDSGYRGEVRAALVNHDPHTIIGILRGERIAQLMILPIPPVLWRSVDELPTSGRGEGGFGSTGKR